MYNVIAKYKDSYAIIDSETTEVEALYEKELLPLLYFGINIEGVSFNTEGCLVETTEIQEFTDEGIRGAQEQEDLEELEDLELDFDDFDEDEDETEDSDEQFEGLDDDELLNALNESYAYRDSVLGALGFEADETEDSDEQLEEDDYEDIEEEELYEEDEDIEDDEYDDSDFEVDAEEDDSDYIYDVYADEDEWEDDDIVVREESTVSKLYKLLNDEQVKLLKRYYLWYSQDLFINARKDTSLGYKDKNRLAIKQSQLNSLRNSGGQWYYAGFVDTGYDGGGYCTLGHKLRYMHVAWDVTVSDLEETFFGERYDKDIENLLDEESCIIFGIKCISDFFEVDSDCTQALQRAQRDSLKDMELMYSQYKDGVADEVVGSFGLMDTIVGIVEKRDKRGKLFGGKNFVPVFGKDGLVEFYKQFRQLNMPVPKSLIQEMRDNLVGWSSHKFAGCIRYPRYNKFTITLERVFGNDFKAIEKYLDDWNSSYDYYNKCQSNPVNDLLCVIFQYECCGYYKYNADTNKDEGGCSKTAKYYLNSLYRSANSKFLDISDYTLESVVKVVNTLDTLEKYKGIINVMDTDLYDYRSSDRVKGFYVDVLGKLNSDKLLRSLRIVPEEYRTTDKIEEYIKLAIQDIEEWREKQRLIKEQQRLKEEEEKRLKEERLRNQKSPTEKRLELEKSKLDTPAGDDEVIDFLLNVDVSKYKNSPEFSLACNIIDTVRKKGGGSASSKQMWHLKRLYTEMTGRDTGSEAKEKFDLSSPEYAEYKKAIEYMLSSTEESKIKNVCDTVNKTGTFTKRQKKYLDEALFMYKSQE